MMRISVFSDGLQSSMLPIGDYEIAGIVLLVFFGVFFFAMGIMDFARRRQNIKRRALVERRLGEIAPLNAQEWQEKTHSLRYQSVAATSALLGDVERQAGEKENEASKLKRDLTLAGYFGPNSVLWYQSTRLFLLVALGFLGLLVLKTYFPTLKSGTQVFIAAGLGGIGFVLPSRYIARRQKQVIEECRNGFPDFMDLMVICVEAGLSPRAAVDRISREIAETYAYFGANLYRSNLELKAGTMMHDALFSLARRTKVEEAAALASLLQQTEQLGTSTTDALRIYSEEMRDRRLMRAEEKANSLPVKLIIPLGLYVFPVMLVVILLPVVIRMKNALLAG